MIFTALTTDAYFMEHMVGRSRQQRCGLHGRIDPLLAATSPVHVVGGLCPVG